MSSIFPFIQPQTAVSASPGMPLYKEIQWDYLNNKPVFSGGEPAITTGGKAVAVWAWKALHCQRYLHEIYSYSYGDELATLIGQPYTEKVKQSEAARYVRECLMINPYILGVENIQVSFDSGTLFVSCDLITIYGGEELSVRV